MAMLLAMYQKMRLIREKNQATLDLTRYTSKLKSVSKNIERVQKMYTSKMATLESQANMMRTRGKSIFQGVFGLAMDNSSPYLNAGMMGSQNYYTQRMLSQFLGSGSVQGVSEVPQQDANGNTIENKFNYVMDGQGTLPLTENAKALIQYYLSNGTLNQSSRREGDRTIISAGGIDDISEQDLAQFNQAKLAADCAYQTQFQNCSVATNNFDQNVSIWLENAKAQLDAEQDEALEPLNYQQTMWELEKTQAEQRLEIIKEELQSYRDLCKEESKDHAPHFGLG